MTIGRIRELTTAQIAGLEIARSEGEALAKAHPEIVEAYVLGATREELAAEHLSDYFQNHSAWAMTSVTEALKLLMDTDERQEQVAPHKSLGGKRGGRKIYEEEIGMFARTHKEMSEHSMRLNELLGPKGRRERALKSVVARELTPYSSEEEGAILQMAGNESYQHAEGPSRGQPDWSRISDVLYEQFGVRRSPRSLRDKKYKIRKKFSPKINLQNLIK